MGKGISRVVTADEPIAMREEEEEEEGLAGKFSQRHEKGTEGFVSSHDEL